MTPPSYTESLPAPSLRDRVRGYWFLRGDAGSLGGGEPILPDGRPEIVFHLADPFRRGDGGVQPLALFAPQIDRPLRVAPCGAVDVVGVRFRPHGAFAFVGAPLDRFLNATPALFDVAPRLARRLRAALVAAGAAPADRARALDAALLDAARDDVPARRCDPRVGEAVECVGRSLGRVAIDAVARAVALSGRQLERAFLREVGLSPKRFARIVRFRAVLLSRANGGGAASWAAIAHDLGYTDQPHLVREFREFAGVSPAAWFAGSGPLDPFVAGMSDFDKTTAPAAE